MEEDEEAEPIAMSMHTSNINTHSLIQSYVARASGPRGNYVEIYIAARDIVIAKSI